MADVMTQEVPSRVPDILRRTVPWVRFMAVVLFLAAGLMIVGGLVMGIGMAAIGGTALNSADGGRAGLGAVPGLMVGVFYAAMGFVNLLPGIFLWRFASRADVFVAGPSNDRLEQALDAQRSYWKFMGVFAIVAFGFGCLAIVAAIAGAAMFSATR